MKAKFPILLFFVVVGLTSTDTAHKFYVSVTNVNYIEKDAALQITTRIFIDDLERVLDERYGVQAQLATDEESEQADMLIEKYLRSKFAVQFDDQTVAFEFLGKQYDNDVAICYMEITDVDHNDKKTLSVQNDVLTDIFEEQKNIVHIKWRGTKKSFVLIKGNDKGMLNL